MASIKIFMKNGDIKDFPHVGRSGGSYTKSVRYEGGFVIVTDEWSSETAFPAQDIERVEKIESRSW
jgi:hypothetical protein